MKLPLYQIHQIDNLNKGDYVWDNFKRNTQHQLRIEQRDQLKWDLYRYLWKVETSLWNTLKSQIWDCADEELKEHTETAAGKNS